MSHMTYTSYVSHFGVEFIPAIDCNGMDEQAHKRQAKIYTIYIRAKTNLTNNDER